MKRGGVVMSIQSLNPATGEVIQTYLEDTPESVQSAIEQAHNAYLSWKNVPFSERARMMRNAADQLEQNAEACARLMTLEMGKLYKDGLAEAKKCAWVCRYYADNAHAFLVPQTVETDASTSMITFQPLGVILAIMPWNFPFWQVFRFAAPNLMAGNVGLLKHASNVFGCALAIEEIFRNAGFPESVFKTLRIGSQQVNAVIEHPQVRGVTLTGSTPAGKAVAGKAGECLKKTVLELGGSDPYIILDDANLDEDVETCVTSRLLNSGQSCIAAKRFIIVDSMYDECKDRFVALMTDKRCGDPFDESTHLGPLARLDLRDELHAQVQRSVQQGAKLLLGGVIPLGEGAYYPATLLSEVQPGMVAFDEELFGPVAALIRARDEDDAIALANRSCFGLGAAVFTQNRQRGERIASEQLEAGCCFVNSMVKSDPRLPFGGIKNSGYGRELSIFGIYEFVNIKTVYVK
jgi:succinate-semialdehyde dehydrogenase / glutarate-semialdehyde dehydrogenase